MLFSLTLYLHSAMKIETSTDQIIRELITTLLPANANLREKHVMLESLNSLVRLAKSEQILEMKTNIRRLTGPFSAYATRSRFRASLIGANWPGQQQFEFMKPE